MELKNSGKLTRRWRHLWGNRMIMLSHLPLLRHNRVNIKIQSRKSGSNMTRTSTYLCSDRDIVLVSVRKHLRLKMGKVYVCTSFIVRPQCSECAYNLPFLRRISARCSNLLPFCSSSVCFQHVLSHLHTDALLAR